MRLPGGCGLSLQLDDDVITPSDHARLLGVTIAAMSARHVSLGSGS